VRSILIAVLLLLMAGAQSLADIRIRSSAGGDVADYLEIFNAVRQSGERVIIDGPCLSACTLVLSIVPSSRICVTRRAVLGFHAARQLDRRSGRLLPAREATRVIEATYPVVIQNWIARHGGLSQRLLLLRGRELAELYPTCGVGRDADELEGRVYRPN
jgi:hypothetical protein